jgi:hypothetical protein
MVCSGRILSSHLSTAGCYASLSALKALLPQLAPSSSLASWVPRGIASPHATQITLLEMAGDHGSVVGVGGGVPVQHLVEHSTSGCCYAALWCGLGSWLFVDVAVGALPPQAKFR